MAHERLSFRRIADVTAKASGHPASFNISVVAIVVWAAAGPFFGYSDSWQLVINTATTVITYLMVFLIQNTQNRDNAATQAKLDELIRSSRASNTFIGIEHLSQEEVDAFRELCAKKAGRANDRRPHPPNDHRTRGHHP